MKFPTYQEYHSLESLFHEKQLLETGISTRDKKVKRLFIETTVKDLIQKSSDEKPAIWQHQQPLLEPSVPASDGSHPQP